MLIYSFSKAICYSLAWTKKSMLGFYINKGLETLNLKTLKGYLFYIDDEAVKLS